MPDEKAQTQGEFIADLIEAYCDARRTWSPPKEIRDGAKAVLAAGFDIAFTEMIPDSIGDLL
jgi:hypothetical protein